MDSRNKLGRAARGGRAALVVSALVLSAGAVCLGGAAEAATVQGRGLALKHRPGDRPHTRPVIGNGRHNKVFVEWNSPAQLSGIQHGEYNAVGGQIKSMSAFCTRQHRVCKLRFRLR